MIRVSAARGFAAVMTAALALALTSTPVFAQNGTLKGKVMDDKGRPVNSATVAFEQVEGGKKTNTITDKDGIWVKTGLAAGVWSMKVTLDKLSVTESSVTVVAGKETALPDFFLMDGGGFRKQSQPQMSKAEADKANTEQEQLKKMMAEANAAIAAGQNDVAIEKIMALTEKMPTCGSCYASLGDVYVKLNKVDDAEKAYLKAIELEPNGPNPYNALSNIYNGQRKFDEAVKMSQKASELTGGAAGGGDFKSVYNTAIIMWNANKFADALAQFKRAVELDPKHAEAQYFLGMSYVNQNKLAEAKAPLQEYLKLAPTGPHAKDVADVLKAIK